MRKTTETIRDLLMLTGRGLMVPAALRELKAGDKPGNRPKFSALPNDSESFLGGRNPAAEKKAAPLPYFLAPDGRQ